MFDNYLRQLYRRLPEWLKPLAHSAYILVTEPTLTGAYARRRWIKRVYSEYGMRQRRDIFLEIARFCHINRPLHGYYFEFGSHEANTIRMAYDAFHHLFDWTYVAFDLFEGLPDISPIDRQEIWRKGKLKTEEDWFRQVCYRHGIPQDKLITVKGFYQKSLNDEVKQRLLPKKAAVIYVDCDLYESTVPVLSFIKVFCNRGQSSSLMTGTVSWLIQNVANGALARVPSSLPRTTVRGVYYYWNAEGFCVCRFKCYRFA